MVITRHIDGIDDESNTCVEETDYDSYLFIYLLMGQQHNIYIQKKEPKSQTLECTGSIQGGLRAYRKEKG